MSTPGAMQRQPEDGSDPAPGALCDKADATLDRLWAVLEDLTRHKADQGVLIELLGCGLHLEEFRAEMRRFTETTAMQDALISFGRQLERQDQAAQVARPRHRHARTGNRPRLRLAGAAAVAATIAAGGGIVVHDDAAVQTSAAPLLSPAALHAASLAPDRAVPFPSPSWSRRARQDVKRAARAPSPALAAPVVTVAPAQPSPSPQQHAGTLVADSTVLDLGILGAASVTLTAEGGGVGWSASQVPGLEVWPSSGVLQDGQSVTVSFRALDQSQSGFGIVDLGGVSITVSWPAIAGLPLP